MWWNSNSNSNGLVVDIRCCFKLVVEPHVFMHARSECSMSSADDESFGESIGGGSDQSSSVGIRDSWDETIQYGSFNSKGLEYG